MKKSAQFINNDLIEEKSLNKIKQFILLCNYYFTC